MAYLIGRTSHFATTFSSQNTLAEQSAQYRLASNRLTSGRKFSDLSSYRSDLSDVLTYRHVVDRAAKDRSNIGAILTITQTYEIALRASTPGTSGGAGGLQSYIEPLLQIVREGLQPNVDADAWRDQHGGVTFDNRLNAIQSLLNQQVADRYIFAGRRYRGGPPVQNLVALTEAANTAAPLPSVGGGDGYRDFLLRNLPASTAERNADLFNALSITLPAVVTGADANALPDHDSDAVVPATPLPPTLQVGTVLVSARQTSVLQVDRSQSIEYGISSNAEAINQTLLATRLIAQALDASTTTLADRTTLLTDARTLFDLARDGLRRVRQSAAGTIATLQVAQERQREIEITTQSLVDRLVAADTTEAGVEISALSQQISATLRTIETRNRLNLATLL